MSTQSIAVLTDFHGLVLLMNIRLHVALARNFAFSVNQCMMSSGGWGTYHDI